MSSEVPCVNGMRWLREHYEHSQPANLLVPERPTREVAASADVKLTFCYPKNCVFFDFRSARRHPVVQRIIVQESFIAPEGTLVIFSCNPGEAAKGQDIARFFLEEERMQIIVRAGLSLSQVSL